MWWHIWLSGTCFPYARDARRTVSVHIVYYICYIYIYIHAAAVGLADAPHLPLLSPPTYWVTRWNSERDNDLYNYEYYYYKTVFISAVVVILHTFSAYVVFFCCLYQTSRQLEAIKADRAGTNLRSTLLHSCIHRMCTSAYTWLEYVYHMGDIIVLMICKNCLFK